MMFKSKYLSCIEDEYAIHETFDMYVWYMIAHSCKSGSKVIL